MKPALRVPGKIAIASAFLVIDVGMVVLLAGGMIYGMTMWRNRRKDPVVEARREERTRELYQKPE